MPNIILLVLYIRRQAKSLMSPDEQELGALCRDDGKTEESVPQGKNNHANRA
ncbi:transposase [Vibrio harveyi]|uniref:Transposase n=1 Tax=Vibrio harveyi TaxID=669 RepID=A0A454CQY9_VIBHA|nr:transposase [Vibrio harveyi]